MTAESLFPADPWVWVWGCGLGGLGLRSFDLICLERCVEGIRLLSGLEMAYTLDHRL